MKTVAIWFKVGSAWEKWEVPFGFGAQYRLAINDEFDADAIIAAVKGVAP